jgi:hypothetical protein
MAINSASDPVDGRQRKAVSFSSGTSAAFSLPRCRSRVTGVRPDLPTMPARAHIQLRSDVGQRPPALDHTLNRLGLVLARKAPSGPPFCHSILLGCWGSFQNPPLHRYCWRIRRIGLGGPRTLSLAAWQSGIRASSTGHSCLYVLTGAPPQHPAEFASSISTGGSPPRAAAPRAEGGRRARARAGPRSPRNGRARLEGAASGRTRLRQGSSRQLPIRRPMESSLAQSVNRR